MDSRDPSLIDRIIHASFNQKAIVVMLVGLALCTNASLSTPVATPPMTIVLGGGYKFFDYIKWCVPINLIMWVLVLIFVPLIYGGLAQ